MPDWDVVYGEKKITDATPSDVLLMNEHLLAGDGHALDFASGLAGNGLFLEKKGYQVSAWDYSQVAIDKINQHAQNHALNLQAEQHDLEKTVVKPNQLFDVLVVSYFLHRAGLRNLLDLLNKNGLLFYQTFSGEQYNKQGPSRAAFRLKQNELLKVFADMTLLFYREDDAHANGNAAKPGQVYLVAKK